MSRALRVILALYSFRERLSETFWVKIQELVWETAAVQQIHQSSFCQLYISDNMINWQILIQHWTNKAALLLTVDLFTFCGSLCFSARPPAPAITSQNPSSSERDAGNDTDIQINSTIILHHCIFRDAETSNNTVATPTRTETTNQNTVSCGLREKHPNTVTELFKIF